MTESDRSHAAAGRMYTAPVGTPVTGDGWTYAGLVVSESPVVDYGTGAAAELGIDPLTFAGGSTVTLTGMLPTGWWDRQRLIGTLTGTRYPQRWRDIVPASSLMYFMGHSGPAAFQALVHASGRIHGTDRLHRTYRHKTRGRR